MEADAHGTDSEEETTQSGRKWKKVLYGGAQPGYEDNYTDRESFLKDMVMNANVRKKVIWTVMRDSIAVSQHVCVVGLVGTVWAHALDGVIDARILLQLDALIFVLGFATLFLTTDDFFSASSLQRHALNFSLFVTGLYILSPIFQTLTRSISSDSIWTSTVCLLLVHLLFHDYTYTTTEPESREDDVASSPGTPQTPSRANTKETAAAPKTGSGVTFSANVSLNASIVASVLIASRLPNHLLVFALMLFSLEFFLLFPFVTHYMRRRSVNFHLAFSCTLIVVSMALIYPVSRLVFSIFVIVILFITVVSPYWLIRIQKYKVEINGPWDEAKLCFDVGD